MSTAHINADHFNRECFCISLDEQALRRSMAAEIGDPTLFEWVQGRLPSMFSARPVVLSQAQMQDMAQVISALQLFSSVSCIQAACLGARLVCAHSLSMSHLQASSLAYISGVPTSAASSRRWPLGSKK